MSLGYLSTTPNIWASTKQQTSHEEHVWSADRFLYSPQRGISNYYHLLVMLKLGTAGSETSLSSICSPPRAIRAQYQLSLLRSEQGGGMFLLLPEVIKFSSLPQGSPHQLLHPAQPLDIPPPQPQALTSVETLLIAYLSSLIVNSLHTSFCRTLDTHLPQGRTPPPTAPVRHLDTTSPCPSPV